MYIISTTDNRLSMIISFYGNVKDFWAASHSFGDRNMAPFSGPFYVNGPQNCMTCNDKPSRVSKLVPCRWQLARLSCYSQRHTHTHRPCLVWKWGLKKKKKKRDYWEEKGLAGFLSHTVTVRYLKNERLFQTRTQTSVCTHREVIVCIWQEWYVGTSG